MQEPLAGGTVLQVDQTASSDQALLRHVRECGQDTNLDRGFGLCAHAIVKKRLAIDASLYTLLQIFSLTLFEKMPLQQAFSANHPSSDDVAIVKKRLG